MIPSLAKFFAGTRLNFVKCVLVELVTPSTARLEVAMRRSLSFWVPMWARFALDSVTRCLGIIVVPRCAERRWALPLSKWELRTRAIAGTGMAASAAAVQYAQKAARVCSYEAQFSPAPPPRVPCRRRSSSFCTKRGTPLPAAFLRWCSSSCTSSGCLRCALRVQGASDAWPCAPPSSTPRR